MKISIPNLKAKRDFSTLFHDLVIGLLYGTKVPY